CYAALVFALHRNGGKLSQGRKLCIGQGFKGKGGSGNAIGIGNCTCGFETYVKGCPPKAVDILPLLVF
ncbi:MAG: iron-sulfur cluster-binding protein, partial [Treponema sp.]|nr:iron-sulfur cluster-binding protein [Treponema sp.]